MSHSTQGFLVKCDAVLRQYILYLHEQANQTSGDQGAESSAVQSKQQNSKKKKRRLDDDQDDDQDDDEDIDEEELAEEHEGDDDDDTSFLRHVQIVQLDDTHLFLTGAPLNLQARLQRQVDLLHERHTYSMEGADIRDNKFKLTTKAGVSKE
jgi:hypothetical protein